MSNIPHFINRTSELKALDKADGGLIVLFGRRRVGKTTLVEHWRKRRSAFYTQAIEAAEGIQVEQVASDLAEVLPKGIVPRSWSELLAALALVTKKMTIIIDELPYLVATQPALPSLLQRWLDHDRPPNVQLVVLGSSRSMMHDLFLTSQSPLYHRAQLVLHIEPMNYRHFCYWAKCDGFDPKMFNLFSLVGGVPQYWQFLDLDESVEDNASRLYFERSARLAAEPDRLLKDEQIAGQQARSILEAIGRGAHRPHEIASRVSVQQTALSRPLALLSGASLVVKEHPFGESARSTKRSLYKISDYPLRFWYQVYSPNRSRWHLYATAQKLRLIHQHASIVLEEEFRLLSPDSSRYWEGEDIGFDSIRFDPSSPKSIIVTELKHSTLSRKERAQVLDRTTATFYQSSLAKRHPLSSIEVLDSREVLERLLEAK